MKCSVKLRYACAFQNAVMVEKDICRALFAHFLLFLQEWANRRKNIETGGYSNKEMQTLLETMEKQHAEQLRKTAEMVINLLYPLNGVNSFYYL